jgi:uncharacterized membrane protein YkvA (DUF1232 family)
MIIKKLKEWSDKLKQSINILYCAYMNKRTPWYAKIMIGIVIAYALSPIDLIPDFIPILGYLDDLLLIPLGIILSYKLVPKDILAECKESASSELNTGFKGKHAALAIIVFWIIVFYIIVKRYLRIFD